MDAEQALLIGAHLLCSQDQWLWDPYDGHRLIFYPDGTGEMISRGELVVLLVAGTEWKLLPLAGREGETSTSSVRPHSVPSAAPSLFPTPATSTLFRGILELTVTRRRPLLYGRHANYISIETLLFETAFQTRRIDVSIDRGEFHLSWNFDRPESSDRYRLRLTLSESPYPPVETWRPAERSTVELVKFSQMTQFCARLSLRAGGESESSRCLVM
ncbi:hypothetical protein B0H17DRAFT_1330739 [Mycena rosella]|uniref:Uncharacterized protein n=1 Tax=Mycena rosella TaxID=1033263 RepID=A0AAD7GFR1_MYCRO|nr:hypothetical protein B0H17DRAFT_1330739 [Mycena rosella]